MHSISSATVLLAVCWTASTSAQLDFLSPRSAPMADLMMTGSELNPRVESLPPQSQKMTFDPTTLNKYQGPFSRQFYLNRHNHFQQQQQNLYSHSDIPISIPITNTNSIDQLQIKNPGPFKTQPQQGKTIAGIQTIQNRLLTLQELMSTPLFSEYMKIPLFRQFVSTPAFQAYLSSPLFQQYWTSPLFKSFFSDSAHFFKNIYPLLNVQQEQEPAPEQFRFRFQPQEQEQQQFQPQYFDNNNYNNYNNYNDDLYTKASTPFIYQQGQEQERGQYGGQFDLDPEFHFQNREQEQRRLRRNEMPLMLWNLISAARQQKEQQQQQQQFQADPQVVMQPPSSLTFEPSAFPFGQGQGHGQFQPEGAQIQPQIPMQAQAPSENQPEILMMVVTEEDKEQSQSQTEPQRKKLPQLERILLERIMRALFLRKFEQEQKQQQEEIQKFAPVSVPVPQEQKVTFVNGDKDNVELKDLTVEKIEAMPTILVRGEPIALNTNLKPETETETGAKPATEMVDIPQEPTQIQIQTETPAIADFDAEMEMTEEDKLKKMKKMKLMKLLKANKRFIKMTKDKDTKDMTYSPASEITFTTSSPISVPEMMTGAEEKIINRIPIPSPHQEMMTGAEEKKINKIPIPFPEMMTGAEERMINNPNVPIPSPAVDAVPVPFTSFDIRPRRQSYNSYTHSPNQNQERMTAIPVNSPQFLQIVQMLRNQQQQEQQQVENTPTVYRLNSFEGQNQFLGSSLPSQIQSQSQPSKFHYTIADQVAPAVNVNSQNTRYETTGVNGLHSVPLTRGQPIYQNGYPQRYAMPINNNYETYSIA